MQPTRVLEFVAVGSGGNAYESLLVVNAKPSALKRALEMMGVAEAPDPPYDAAKLPKEMGVYLYVTWPDRKTPIRLEKLLLNNVDRQAARADAVRLHREPVVHRQQDLG